MIIKFKFLVLFSFLFILSQNLFSSDCSIKGTGNNYKCICTYKFKWAVNNDERREDKKELPIGSINDSNPVSFSVANYICNRFTINCGELTPTECDRRNKRNILVYLDNALDSTSSAQFENITIDDTKNLIEIHKRAFANKNVPVSPKLQKKISIALSGKQTPENAKKYLQGEYKEQKAVAEKDTVCTYSLDTGIAKCTCNPIPVYGKDRRTSKFVKEPTGNRTNHDGEVVTYSFQLPVSAVMENIIKTSCEDANNNASIRNNYINVQDDKNLSQDDYAEGVLAIAADYNGDPPLSREDVDNLKAMVSKEKIDKIKKRLEECASAVDRSKSEKEKCKTRLQALETHVKTINRKILALQGNSDNVNPQSAPWWERAWNGIAGVTGGIKDKLIGNKQAGNSYSNPNNSDIDIVKPEGPETTDNKDVQTCVDHAEPMFYAFNRPITESVARDPQWQGVFWDCDTLNSFKFGGTNEEDLFYRREACQNAQYKIDCSEYPMCKYIKVERSKLSRTPNWHLSISTAKQCSANDCVAACGRNCNDKPYAHIIKSNDPTFYSAHACSWIPNENKCTQRGLCPYYVDPDYLDPVTRKKDPNYIIKKFNEVMTSGSCSLYEAIYMAIKESPNGIDNNILSSENVAYSVTIDDNIHIKMKDIGITNDVTKLCNPEQEISGVNVKITKIDRNNKEVNVASMKFAGDYFRRTFLKINDNNTLDQGICRNPNESAISFKSSMTNNIDNNNGTKIGSILLRTPVPAGNSAPASALSAPPNAGPANPAVVCGEYVLDPLQLMIIAAADYNDGWPGSGIALDKKNSLGQKWPANIDEWKNFVSGECKDHYSEIAPKIVQALNAEQRTIYGAIKKIQEASYNVSKLAADAVTPDAQTAIASFKRLATIYKEVHQELVNTMYYKLYTLYISRNEPKRVPEDFMKIIYDKVYNAGRCVEEMKLEKTLTSKGELNYAFFPGKLSSKDDKSLYYYNIENPGYWRFKDGEELDGLLKDGSMPWSDVDALFRQSQVMAKVLFLYNLRLSVLREQAGLATAMFNQTAAMVTTQSQSAEMQKEIEDNTPSNAGKNILGALGLAFSLAKDAGELYFKFLQLENKFEMDKWLAANQGCKGLRGVAITVPWRQPDGSVEMMGAEQACYMNQYGMQTPVDDCAVLAKTSMVDANAIRFCYMNKFGVKFPDPKAAIQGDAVAYRQDPKAKTAPHFNTPTAASGSSGGIVGGGSGVSGAGSGNSGGYPASYNRGRDNAGGYMNRTQGNSGFLNPGGWGSGWGSTGTYGANTDKGPAINPALTTQEAVSDQSAFEEMRSRQTQLLQSSALINLINSGAMDTGAGTVKKRNRRI